MYKKIVIFSIPLCIAVSGVNAKEVIPTMPPGVIVSPYNACKEVIVVSKDKYVENAEQWKAFETKCKTKVQVAVDAGFTKIGPLNEATQYLNLASIVADKIIVNLNKSHTYAQCSSACFNRVNTCNEVNCTERRNEILQSLKVQTRKARIELALSQEASNLLQVNVGNVLTLEEDKFINKDLRDFEAGTPNPVGKVAMQPGEMDHAREIIKHERAQVDQEYKAMLAEKKVKDTPDFSASWKAKILMDKIEKRQEEHQLKYRQLVFEESPIFAVIEKPNHYENGDVPVWTEKQIAAAFSQLASNADKTKAIVQESLNRGKLEFSRTKGEALGAWLKGLAPGTKDSNDLLYYMGMKNQVEEVLKEDTSMCAVATTMSERLSSKDMQNMGVVFAGSFALGALTKGASEGVVAVFHIGRALSGAESAGLTGLAIGSTFLGDSFRQYNTTVAEVATGMRPATELDGKRTNIKFNLIFAPSLATSGWGLGKTLYNALGKKMAKDLPEISALMKKAGTNQAMRDEAVDKWIMTKVKNAVKSKVIDGEDEALLKTEAGGKILDSLAADIQKNNPKFFNDPNNFEYFLKTAATSIRKRPGDPADLADKSRKLFLSLNTDAFASWDPKARAGLMKVYSEGVEELRNAYSKDPSAYAKFTTDPAAQEKIMLAALKRSGVVDDADAAVMKRCALKK